MGDGCSSMNRAITRGMSVLLWGLASFGRAGTPQAGDFVSTGLRAEIGPAQNREANASLQTLARVVIHRVNLKEASIAEALDLLVREGERTQRIEGFDVKFLLTPAAALSKFKITMDVQNIPAIEALKYFTKKTKTSFSFKDQGLIVVDLQK